MDKTFLLIDQGNSRIKYRLTDYSGTVLEENSIGNNAFTQDFLPDSAYASILICKSGGLVFNVQDFRAGARIHFLSASDFPEIEWSYADLHTLGADRVAALAGARYNFPGQNIILADAGTCLTIDFLRSDGKHLGGFISPGYKMRLQAMHHFTEALPQVGGEQGISLLPGKSTTECMQSGSFAGLIGELDFHFAHSQYFDSQTVVRILSGGDADDLAHHLKQSTFVVRDLVFQGLHQLALRLLK
jgi:type III pantothenate kinase